MVAQLLSASGLMAGPIVWNPAGTISADTDIFTAGSLTYAYTQSSAAATVNGVSFAAGNSSTSLGGGNITLTGFTGGVNTSAFGNPAGLSTEYAKLTRGATYTSAATSTTVTFNSLTAGHVYAAQVWVNDSRTISGRSETLNGGGNIVTLDYDNNDGAAGGAGQFSIGRFAADAVSQSFTMQGNASTQLNAVQLRNITNLGNWVGSAGATWDASTTSNFASNLFSAALVTTDFATASAPLSSVTFADQYWNAGSATTVTQTTVNIAAGGVSTGTVHLDNSAVDYTFTSADASGITGATAVSKTGSGIVTFAGANTYTGLTLLSNGTARVGSSAAFGGTGALQMTNSAQLDLNGFNAAFTGLTASATATITDQSSGTGVSTFSFGNAGPAGSLFLDGASRDLAIRVTNDNGNFNLTNASNTFSGGLTLAHTANGTRLSPGVIVAGAYGTGAITVGEAATDRAGIYFATSNQTLANDIVANTGLGTDRVGTLRIGTTGIQLTGTLTAGLSDFTFSTNETGSVTATGKITGSNGLKLLSHTLSPSQSLTVTLSNAAGDNDYSGNTTINDSAQAGRSYTLALGVVDQIPSGTGKGNVIVNSNSTGVGRLNLGGFSETINGLSGNGVVDGGSGTPVLTIGDNNASGVFSGSIVNTTGTLSVVKTGTGSQTIGGSSSYAGSLEINSGTLIAGSGSALGSTAAGTTVASGATLDLNSQNIGAEVITVSGTGVGGLGAIVNNGGADQTNATQQIVLAGDTTFGGTRRWDVRGSGSSLSGNFDLTKIGNMQISLVQTNVSVQDIYVNAGLLSVEYGGNINNTNAGTIFVGSGANFGVGDFALSISVSKPIDLANNATFSTTSGGSNGNAVIAAAVGLTGNSFINPQSGSTLRLDGALTGTGGFTQNGAGTIDLTANSTYDGDTTISAGRLLVNGSLGDTEVTVALGATLGGSGVIGTNSVLNTLTVNGTLAPGNSPGILTVNDNLGLNGALAIEVNDLVAGTGHDQVIVNGDVSLGGLLTLAWNLTTAATPGTELILIENDGSDFLTGSFSNVADLSVITDNLSGSWQVRYSGGSGNDLSIYAIPEPSTSLLAMAGVLGLTLRRRRSGV